MAGTPELTLKPGDAAPSFETVAHDGSRVALKDLKGKYVVLYFYPRDSTPGCTVEACAFRDQHSALQQRGAVVLGASGDSAASHGKFVARFNLPFPLLVDGDHAILTAYGAWGEKVFMGRKHMGVYRVTFLIGPDGRIKHVWPKVKPETHAAEVLAALDAAQAGA